MLYKDYRPIITIYRQLISENVPNKIAKNLAFTIGHLPGDWGWKVDARTYQLEIIRPSGITIGYKWDKNDRIRE